MVRGADEADIVIDPPAVGLREVRADLSLTAPAGVYTVSYRVDAADGHPVAGSFVFTVAGRNTPAAAAPVASGTPAAELAPASASGFDYWPWIGAGVAGIALLLVGARLRVLEARGEL